MPKEAEPLNLISRIMERQVLHKFCLNELPLILSCIKSTILANRCISWIGRKGSTPANRLRTKMVFQLTQRRLTIFFPGEQVEHVADVRALQSKGSHELSCCCTHTARTHKRAAQETTSLKTSSAL